MKYKYYLEQKIYTDHVLAKILADADAKTLHYKDGYRAENGNFTIFVIGFESEDQIRKYVAAMKNLFLIE